MQEIQSIIKWRRTNYIDMFYYPLMKVRLAGPYTDFVGYMDFHQSIEDFIKECNMPTHRVKSDIE